MFNSRLYKPEDYKMLTQWWEAWNYPPVPEVFLSETGIIITYNDEPVCAGFVYTTDSKVSWGEHYILNKKAPRVARKECITVLISEMCKTAKDMGFLVMMSSVSNESLINKLTASGFGVGDKNMVNLVKAL